MGWNQKQTRTRKPKNWGQPGEKPERKKMQFNESAMVRGCVLWFRAQFPTRVIVKIDNEGLRSKSVGALKKREGLHPGALDLFIPEPIERRANIVHDNPQHMSFVQNQKHPLINHTSVAYSGLWLEGKHGRNKLAFEQTLFIEKMEMRGYYCGVFYNLDEFVFHVNTYFGTNYKP